MKKVAKKPSTALYPLPAVLVSCGEGSDANIITLAWAGTLCSDPPLVGIGVRPSRHSHPLIEAEEAFVVNMPRADQAGWVDHCGMVSGSDENKWAACGFTQGECSKLRIPLIRECPVNIECELRQVLQLGSHDLFIGEVVAVQMDEDVLNEQGQLDVVKTDPLAYVSGEYRRVGELLGRFGFSER